ncbi:hypothetical protein ACFLR7_04260 [Acidobacteriota bacterium]
MHEEFRPKKKAGSYLRKLHIIFKYLQLITKGTEKEFLFKSIPSWDSLRKYKYRESKNPFHLKLVKYLYERSFVDKVSMYKPVQLSLLAMRDGVVEGGDLDKSLLSLPESEIPKCLWARKHQLENEADRD